MKETIPVRLELQTEAHATALFEILSDPELHRFTDSAPPESLDALKARLRRLEHRLSPDGAAYWLNWVVRNVQGDVVGYVQATVGREDLVAEIAYVLGVAFWGQGLAFAACREMICLLVADYQVTRIRAVIDCNNVRSLRLMDRLGLAKMDSGGGSDFTFEREINKA